MSTFLSKLSHWFSPKKAAVLAAFLLVLSLIPIFYLGWYDYPTGDSLRYGAAAHLALKNGNSFFSSAFWQAVFTDVRTEFLYFNGTWSAMILWRLDPDIWAHVNESGQIVGTHLYSITPWISMVSICLGTFFFLYVVLVRLLNLPKAFWVSVSSLTVLITVQWIPTARGGIYFYPGVIKYILAYGIMLLGLGWFLLYPETHKIRYIILSAIALVYVGGAGYPEFLIAAVSCALIFLVHLIAIIRSAVRKDPAADQPSLQTGPSRDDPSSSNPRHAKVNTSASADSSIVKGHTLSRSFHPQWLLLLPFVLFMIAFIISAKAPGTAIRGGENAAFSMSKAFSTILNCFTYGASQGIQYLKTAPLSIAFFFGVILSTYTLAGAVPWETLKAHVKTFNPLLLVSGYLTYAASFAAELFVGDDVTAGISGGVYDTYFMIFILALTVAAIGIGWWVRYLHETRKQKLTASKTYSSSSDDLNHSEPLTKSPISAEGSSAENLSADSSASNASSGTPGTTQIHGSGWNLRIVWMILCLIACLAGGRHFFRNTLDYACFDFIRSGRLEDFIAQTDEYKAILFNDQITNAVLPQMNDNQYPFMFMAPTEDPETFTCYAMEYFYGKESVKAIPRDEFYERYGTSMEEIIQNEIKENTK